MAPKNLTSTVDNRTRGQKAADTRKANRDAKRDSEACKNAEVEKRQFKMVVVWIERHYSR
jgi:hypothetical protein